MPIKTFAAQALADFQATASIVPSSRYLAEAMTEALNLTTATTVVEFGPGTGAMTTCLLAEMPADARLLAFEINSRFVEVLRERFAADPRLEVIESGAEKVGRELAERGISAVDAALSSLGFAFMSREATEEILSELIGVLNDEALFTQFQYVSRVRLRDGRAERFDCGELLADYFATVDRRMIVRNFPPAFVYRCQGPLRRRG